MTWTDFKAKVGSLLKSRGDIGLPTDDTIVLTTFEQELLDVANRFTILSLVTQDTTHEILRTLGDGYYIRMPNMPGLGEHEVDVDNELILALANRVAGALARDKNNSKEFTRVGNRLIQAYDFKLYNTKV